MINYKKGLLSLAAVLALSTAANAANDYLRLASETNDYRWVMFGVDGFAGNSQTADFSAGGNWNATLFDLGGNEVATSGLPALTGAGAPGDMVEVKALNISGTDALSRIDLNMDMTGTVFSYTEPMRTMFITAPSTASEPTAMISYKSSLEGETVEIQLDGSATTTYTVEISALNTFDNPASAGVKTVGGDSNSSLSAMSDVIDYDLTNNPQDSSSYLQTTDQDTTSTTGGAATRVYSYDAINGAWKIYDSSNTAVANDFASLDKGVGYWGRMDTDGNNLTANTDAVQAGLILGSQGIVDADYDDNNLSEGWNLMSFDSQKPDIIYASTGLIINDDISGGVNDTVTIYDYTGINSVDVALLALDTTDDHVRKINMAIESAKAKGEFSEAFDLRAFFDVAGTNMVLISNKRFFVSALSSAASFGPLTSLNTEDGFVWDESVAAPVYADYSADGSTTNGNMYGSKYGAYTLAFKPVVADAASAADLDQSAGGADNLRSAAIQVNEGTTADDDLIYLIADNTTTAGSIATTVLGTAAALTAQDSLAGVAAGATGSAIGLDMDLDGTNETVLAVSDTPFYIRDHTFIRVLTYDFANATAGTDTHVISGSASTTTGGRTISSGATPTLAELVTNINAINDVAAVTTDTGVYAVADGANKIILVSATANTNLFDVRDDDTLDLFSDASTTTGYGDGAVADVYHLDALAKGAINPHEITLPFANQAAIDALNNTTVLVTITGLVGGVGADVAAITTVATDVERDAALTAIVGEVIAQAAAAGQDVNAYHDFNVTSPSYPATITVESYSIPDLDLDVGTTGAITNNGADANSGTFGQHTSVAGDATDDLKFNAVSTKSYAQEGPLYTMKEQGYTVKAIIGGNTNIDGGTVAWDSIDMTRTAREMYDSQDFNLFSIDGKAGYWTYLETNTDTNDLNVTIVSSSLTPTVKHHFDADATTARNHTSTSLTVTVGGLDAAVNGDSTERVWASIGGTTVELVGDPSIGQYTADIDTYAISGVAGATANTDVTVSVSNGEGWLLASQSVGTIDGVKPNVPTISLAGGFTVDSNSTDVAGYYIFKTFISEDAMHATDVTTDSNYIGYVLDGAASIDFCSSSAMSFNSAISLLSVAVDGEGNFTTGNISDVASEQYYPIEKGSTHFSHLGLGAPADQLGLTYGSDCSPAAAESTTDIGVSIKSVTTGVVAKLAIAAVDGVTFDLDIPYTIYVTDDTNIAEIKFDAAYLGKPFYVQFDGVVYDGTLPTVVTGGGAGLNVTDYDVAGSALDLNRAAAADSNTGAAGSITGQSF